MSRPSSEAVAVRWLLAQSIAFGFTAALLGVVANALFLDEYGSTWLPVTYVFIGLAGLLLSGAVARSVRRASLERVASVVLGGATVTLIAAWLIAAGAGGAWVSAPLLVLFPVLLQLGFVFIGGQAGRILDIGGIKVSFPRILAGFPLGAIAGGLAAGWLVTVLGRTEQLLLPTAIAQGVFLGLLLVTGRRFAPATGTTTPPVSGPTSRQPGRPPISAFVVLIFSYQVLSAIGSQLADFLVFDRAAARYGDGEELARFIARYTALMNIVSIAFLALLAGVLLRRFGLRLGLLANPGVLTVFAAAMAVVSVTAGTGSLALFSVVAFARIADIALTDGTTRTSINAAYQVLPETERLVVQTKVEGVGVPLAIGFSGVLVLALDTLPFPVPALVVATLIVCAVWTAVAALVHRGYVANLVAALSRRWMADDSLAADEDEEAAARQLLTADDARDVRLGLDLLSAMSSPAPAAELLRLAHDPRAEVRLAALARMAADGDANATRRLAGEVTTASTANDARVRRAAARALVHVDGDDRRLLSQLLRDADPGVRHDALQSVGPGDVAVVDTVIDALGDPRTSAVAAEAVGRLGDAVVPEAELRLGGADAPVPPASRRLVRALRPTGADAMSRILGPALGHRDREFGLAVLEVLAQPAPAREPLATDVRAVFADDVRSAARVLAAAESIDGDAVVLRRALADEFDLVRRRVAAALTVLYGSARLGPAVRAFDAGGRDGRALAVETIEVTLPRGEASLALAVLSPDLAAAERSARLGGMVPDEPPAGWLDDLVNDRGDHWRSSWLRTCAAYTARCRGIPLQPDSPIADPDLQEVLGCRDITATGDRASPGR
jgi:hypothetical protein